MHPRLGRAHRIGITGPPGAVKSTLFRALIEHFRCQNKTVAVLAVDPTSPFTGGALLGDRIRMNEISMNEGVFIRSMGTRGSLGGLSITTKEVADVMDAFGFDFIIIETVGVGQSELDVAATAVRIHPRDMTHVERFLLLQIRRVLLSIFALTIALISTITYGSVGNVWLLVTGIVIALFMFVVVLFLPTHLLENPMRHARSLKPQ